MFEEIQALMTVLLISTGLGVFYLMKSRISFRNKRIVFLSDAISFGYSMLTIFFLWDILGDIFAMRGDVFDALGYVFFFFGIFAVLIGSFMIARTSKEYQFR